MKKEIRKKNKFSIARWFVLSLAIISNAFIVSYSFLSSEQTKVLNSFFTTAFIKGINSITKKDIKKIPLEKIEIRFSKEEEYKCNYIPGYELEEIPLGSAKEICCSFSPLDASDKSITYSAEPSDAVSLNQSSGKITVIGLKPGNCVIKANSHDGNFESQISVKIVETVAPVSYTVTLDKEEIPIGSYGCFSFDIDGGVLSHDELINSRYYDTKKLSFSSSDSSIAEVDKNGVIYPKSVGNAFITVSDKSNSRTFNIVIKDGDPCEEYANLIIHGSDVCYANDMILDQSSHKNHYQLQVRDGENELDPEDYIWSTSNELLVKVDKHGVMRGFRKTTNAAETARVFAKSKITGQIVSFNVEVRNQLPTRMDVYLITGGNTVWNQKKFILSVGDDLPLGVSYDINTQEKKIIVTSDDETIISITNEQSSAVLHVFKEGTCNVTVSSVANPNLVFSATYTVVKAGAIATGDVENTARTIRKSIGHAMVFMVAQIFTFLALYMFLYDKKWWIWSTISMGEGIFLSILSEVIQYFVPTRSAAFIDVLIDLSGVLVGVLIVGMLLLLIYEHKKKKEIKLNKV